jgi:hypothetical protein
MRIRKRLNRRLLNRKDPAKRQGLDAYQRMGQAIFESMAEKMFVSE